MDDFLQCPICLGIFDDPWLAADGFCYCLKCLDAWIIASGGDWLSPRTNVRYPETGAFLGKDFQRSALARQLKARQLSPVATTEGADEVVVRLATSRDGGRLVAPRELQRDALAAASARWPELGRRPLVLYSLLELAFHAGAVCELHDGAIELLMAWDRALSRAPFVCIGVWLSLVDDLVTSARSTALLPQVLEHCVWRLLRRDALWLTAEALRCRGIPVGHTGEFPRAVCTEGNGWAATFGSRAVRVEAAQGPRSVPELSTSKLRVQGSGEQVFFMESQSTRYVPGSRGGESFWEARRKFAHAARASTAPAASAASAATTRAAYTRAPPHSPTPPPPPAPPVDQCSSGGELPKDFTVFERELKFLPRYVEYSFACSPPLQLIERLRALRYCSARAGYVRLMDH